MSERKPRRGDTFEVVLDGLDAKGHAVGVLEGFTFLVRRGVPGSTVRVSVRKRRKARIEATIEEVLDAGPAHVEPRCSHFASCGGCSFQGVDYAAQLVSLHGALVRTLAPLELESVDAILPAADPWHYRNKMDFTFGARRWIEEHEPADAPNGFAVGLHVPGRYDKVLDVATCHIAFEQASAILASVRELAKSAGLSAWDVREHTGLLRHLVLRKGFATGEIMADLVTTERAEDEVRALVDAVLARHPEITTFVQHVNDGVSLVATGDEHVLFGPGVIHEELAGVRFRISPASFFQTNTAQAEELVRVVREEAGVREGERVLDLYCGSGLFSLAFARSGASVLGFEVVEDAVRDARDNAARNAIEGARFVAGDLVETLAAHVPQVGGPPPDVCIIDPPRAGMHAKVVAALVPLAIPRVVYVSCNPASAARDLVAFRAAGYRIERARPIDLFPHTPHVECVFTLRHEGEA